MRTVIRSAPFETRQAGDDGLTLTGYAAVFNTATRIDDLFEGTFDEVIAPGAFRDSLSRRAPVLQFDHGQHPMVGSLPLGRFESLTEDERGLAVRARLTDNWLIQPVRDAIADGAVRGMSFRFRVTAETWTERRRDVPLRTIRAVELFEAGPVVWPAYPSTSVGVRKGAGRG